MYSHQIFPLSQNGLEFHADLIIPDDDLIIPFVISKSYSFRQVLLSQREIPNPFWDKEKSDVSTSNLPYTEFVKESEWGIWRWFNNTICDLQILNFSADIFGLELML